MRQEGTAENAEVAAGPAAAGSTSSLMPTPRRPTFANWHAILLVYFFVHSLSLFLAFMQSSGLLLTLAPASHRSTDPHRVA